MALIPGYRHKHVRIVEVYAQRHFTDPVVSLEDAAVFYGLNERTLRRSLEYCGTRWRAILRELRCARAAELLERTAFKIDYVARLSGYSSTAAFGTVFRERYKSTPSQYRRGKKGPARAGGVTGAFARRARGSSPTADGWWAVWSRERDEARERIDDRRHLLALEPLGNGLLDHWDEIERECEHPRHLREEATYWRTVRAGRVGRQGGRSG
jgi:AraC-like DNA-binding protein